MLRWLFPHISQICHIGHICLAHASLALPSCLQGIAPLGGCITGRLNIFHKKLNITSHLKLSCLTFDWSIGARMEARFFFLNKLPSSYFFYANIPITVEKEAGYFERLCRQSKQSAGSLNFSYDIYQK